MARVALVTGGSRGIGEAISKALKAEGYEVAATYAGNDEKAAFLSGAGGGLGGLPSAPPGGAIQVRHAITSITIDCKMFLCVCVCVSV